MYSWIGRFIIHTLISLNLGKEKLFGSSDFGIPLRFPVKPRELVDRGIFSKEVVDKFINRSTLLSYYFNFIEPERKVNILEDLWSSKNASWSIENAFGINRSSKPFSNIPKYCPVCNMENWEQYGEIYWNLFHQIPDIQLCIDHNCFLEDCINTSHSQKKYPFFLPQIDDCPVKKPRYNTNDILLALAKSCVNVVSNDYTIDFDYTSRARELGYSLGNRVDQIAFENDFNEYYPKEIFGGIEYSPLLFIRYKITNPYRHIMLDYFLLRRKEKRGTIVPSNKVKFWDKEYFGNGPWDCIDPKCRKKIKKPEFNYDGKARRTIGLFSCSCDSRYSMSYLIERDKITKTNVRKIRKSKIGSKPKKAPMHVGKELKTMRKEWLELKSKGKLTSEGRRRLYYLSARLKTIDKDWVSSVSSKIKQIKNDNGLKMKASSIEKQIHLVTDAIEFFQEHPPSFRITIPQILRRAKLGTTALDLTAKQLASKHVESIIDFQIRRLHAVAKKLLKNNEKLTPSRLLFKAHIWKKNKKVVKEAERLVYSKLN